MINETDLVHEIFIEGKNKTNHGRFDNTLLAKYRTVTVRNEWQAVRSLTFQSLGVW